MTAWTSDELTRIGEADELQIAARRQNGALGAPRTIWVVRVADDLYVRSAYGTRAAWYRATQATHEGWIQAGGVEKEVAFADAGGLLDAEIDAAYWEKYRRHGAQYVDPVTNDESHETTIQLVPRASAT